MTLSRHYGSLKVFVCYMLDKVAAVQCASALYWHVVQNGAGSFFSFHIATSSEVSRSQINKRSLWSEARRSRVSEMPPVCFEAQLCCPVCHNLMSGSPLALSIHPCLGKLQIKHLAGLHSRGTLPSIKKHLQLVSFGVVKCFQPALGTFLLTFVVQNGIAQKQFLKNK